MTPTPSAIEQWARALCRVWGVDPDEQIGFPKNPRWMSFSGYARMAIEAREIVEGKA